MASVLENDPVLLVDSRQALNSFKKIAVLAGPKNVVTQIFPSNSSSSSTQSVTILTPSTSTLLNRYILYHMVGTVQVNGTAPTGNLYNPGVGLKVGLSENWFTQIVQNENIQIGTVSNYINSSQCGLELMRLNKRSKNDAIYQSLTGGALPDFATTFQAWAGTNRDVLGDYGDVNQSDHVCVPRTNRINVVSTTSTNMVLAFDVYFPSMVPPFLQSDETEAPGLCGQTNYICNINFISDLSRMLSILVPTGYTYTGISNFTINQFELQAQFITPNETVLKALNSTSSLYNYYQITNFPTQIGTIAPATAPNARPTISFALNQITFNTVPDYIICGARLTASVPSNNPALVPRYWLPIVNTAPCQLYWDNNSVLNGMNRQQIYNSCVRNGLMMSYDQFCGRDVTYGINPNTYNGSQVLGGGFLVLNPSKDLFISNDNLTNGVMGTHTLTGTIIFENQAYSNPLLPATPQYELFIIALYGGVLRCEFNGTVEAQTGLMDAQTAYRVLNSGHVGIPDDVFSKEMVHAGYQGGAFLDKLKNFHQQFKQGLSKGLNYVNANRDKIIKGVQFGLNNLDKVQQARQFLGLGYNKEEESEEEQEDEYDGGAYVNTDEQTLSNKKMLALEYMKNKRF